MRGLVLLIILSSLACNRGQSENGAASGQPDAEAHAVPDAAPLGAAPDAANPTPPPPTANAGAVVRFADEVPLPNINARVAEAQAIARDSGPYGSVIATLAMGAPVLQIASHDGFLLCVFTDPKDPNRTIEGWIGKEGFVAGPAPVPTDACPADKPVRLLVDDTWFCGKQCSKDKDCGSGEACIGKANLEENGAAGAPVTACGTRPPTPARRPGR